MINHRAVCNRLLSDYRHSARLAKEEASQLVLAKDKTITAEKAQAICQAVMQSLQETVHKQICGVVTRCLEAIFPDRYEFSIRFERKRGKTEAKPMFLYRGHEINPLRGSGKGKKDIAAFALRIACLVLSRPKRRRLIILDEPFLRMWEGLRPLVGDLLVQLSHELDIQFIIVSHEQAYKIGKVIELKA